MSLTMELVRFTVAEADEARFLAAREAAVADLSSMPGLVSATLARGEDGGWVDVLLWRSRAEAVAADEALRGGLLPAAGAWAATIESVTTMLHAEVVHAEVVHRVAPLAG